jgi:hypothetical protein
MKEHILIVTCEYDPHADALVRLLSVQGHQPTRIHTADIPCKTPCDDHR